MRKYYGFEAAEFPQYLYEYRERDAVHHVFRVASSLDSMVVGEPQILGQVKEAYATARAVGAVNSQLDALLRALSRWPRECEPRRPLPRRRFPSPRSPSNWPRRSSVTSKGKAFTSSARARCANWLPAICWLMAPARFTSATARYERAAALAKKFDGEAIPFEQLYDTVSRRYRHYLDRRSAHHLPQGARREVPEPSQEPPHVLHRHRGATRR